MSLDKAIQNLKFDVRMSEINAKNGSVSKEELKKHLDSIPDSAANADTLKIFEDKDETQEASH